MENLMLYSWEAPEFEKQEKTIFWDLGIFLFGAIILVVALFRAEFILGLLSILATLSLWILGKREPRIVKFALRKDGLQVDDLLYHYSNLKSFWIFDESLGVNELVVRSSRVFLPLIHIHLHKQDAKHIKAILSQHLKEQEEQYPASEMVAKLISW